MYDIGVDCVDGSVAPGTNLLIVGPPMTGKRELAFGVLAEGFQDGEGGIVVTTKDSARKVEESFADRAPDGALGIVDCVTRQQGMGEEAESDLVRYASSPNDLTGIGIEFSELLRLFYKQRGIERNRTVMYSLSTLLMYSNLQTVFRFLHVSTGRVQSADGLGLFLIDDTAHDEQTMSTLKQLFDGVIEVREDDGERQCRASGIEGASSEWTAY
ncbi:MAG: RAD55 family ATPase [Halobacteriaceae archaeon]